MIDTNDYFFWDILLYKELNQYIIPLSTLDKRIIAKEIT